MPDQSHIVQPGFSTAEKVTLLRRLREERYEQLKDAVYARRGWSPDGIPTKETIRRLGLDFPEVMALLEAQEGRFASYE